MGVISSWIIGLSAETQGLERGFQAALGSANRFAAQLSGIGGPAGVLGGLLGGAGGLAAGALAGPLGLAAAGIRGIVADIRAGIGEATERISRFVDESQRLGIGVNALRKLAVAAELSGSSLETVERGVVKMMVALAKAGEGGAASKIFERIGLSAAELQAAGPAEAFQKIAEAITAIEDPTQRVAAAVGIFGKSGAELIPTLAEIADKGSQASDVIEELGGRMSPENARLVEAMGNAWSIFIRVLGNLWDQVTVLVAGPLKDLADWLTRIVGLLARGVEWLAGNSDAQDEMANSSAAAAAAMEEEAAAADKLADAQKRAEAVAAELATPSEKLASRQAELEELYRAGALSLELYRRGMARAQEQFDQANATKKSPLFDDGQKLFDETRTAAEKHAAELARLQKMVQAGAIDWDTYARAVEKADEQLAQAEGRRPGEAPRAPAGALAGTVEAFRRINELKAGQQTERDQLAEQRKQTALLEQIRDAWKQVEQPALVAVEFP